MNIAATLEPVDPGIGEFCALVNAGVETWVRAGEILCRLKERDPDIFNVVLAENPHLSHDILLTFERIGRREVYPYLLVDGSPGSRMLSALPYDMQIKLYGGEVPVVVRRGDHTTTLRKRVADLTPTEAARVFAADRVRPVAEQTKIVQKDQEDNRRRKEAARAAEVEPPEVESSRSLANRLACAIVREYAVTPGRGDDDARSALSLLIGAQLAESPLDEDPKDALTRVLTLAHDMLLEARSHLAHVQHNSKFDSFIANGLSSIGQLRFALSSGVITR